MSLEKPRSLSAEYRADAAIICATMALGFAFLVFCLLAGLTQSGLLATLVETVSA